MSMSGEHRLLACCRRHLADDSEALQELLSLTIEELFGRLPRQAGWQPVLPEIRALLSGCTNHTDASCRSDQI